MSIQRSPESMMAMIAHDRARHGQGVKKANPQGADQPERHWYGRRASEHALPLSDLGCRTLGVHLTTTTIKERA